MYYYILRRWLLEEMNINKVIGIGHSTKSTKVRPGHFWQNFCNASKLYNPLVIPLRLYCWVLILGVHSVKRHLRKCLPDAKKWGPYPSIQQTNNYCITAPHKHMYFAYLVTVTLQNFKTFRQIMKQTLPFHVNFKV